MPCDSSYMIGTERTYKDEFCSACTALEQAGISIPPAAAEAWARHKREDADRIASENANARLARLKREGMAKLTSAERDALGLRGE